MQDDGEETVHGLRCHRAKTVRENGAVVKRWLSYDYPGVPILTLATDPQGQVLKRVDVEEFMTVDIEGATLLFPPHITGHLTFPFDLKIDKASVRVNQPISPSEFDLATTNVDEIYDWDTGVRVNLETGRSFDRDMNEILPLPTPVDATRQPMSPRIKWILVANVVAIIAFVLFSARRLFWSPNHLG